MNDALLLPGCRERALVLGDDYERRGGLWLPPDAVEVEMPATRPIGIGLFAGAGGFDLGLTQAGFHVAAATDGWATAAATYLLNLGSPETMVHCIGDLPEGNKREKAWHAEHSGQPVTAAEMFEACRFVTPADNTLGPGDGWIANQDVPACEHYYLGDIRALTGQQILDDLGVTGDDIGVVVGGPPCQGFSRAGKRQADDPRNELVFEFVRVVIEIQPQAWCMENVPGMLDMVTKEGLPVIDAISLMAAKGGMGTFDAIRRSLHETAGVGAALRTQKATGRRMPPGTSGAGHFEKGDADAAGDPQLDLFGEAA